MPHKTFAHLPFVTTCLPNVHLKMNLFIQNKEKYQRHGICDFVWPTQSPSKGNTQKLELREDIVMGKTEENI